jgi:cytochrome c
LGPHFNDNGTHRSRRTVIVTSLTLVLMAATAAVGYQVSSRYTDRKLATSLTRGNPNNAPRLLRRYGCAGCHSIDGLNGADGLVGPPLQHLRKRTYIAGRFPNTPDTLVRWITYPQKLSPGSAMPDTGITEAEARDVAAYLYTQ